MEELIDREKELERLGKERAACQKEIDFISGKLANEKFVSKAPQKVVDAERAKLDKATQRMEKILESIAAFN